MTQDEIIEMARDLAERFGVRMCDEYGNTHDEELYAMGVDDVIDIIKLVAAKEREACVDIADNLARSPAEFATMAEYKAYKLGVMLYSNAIRARSILRGEA